MELFLFTHIPAAYLAVVITCKMSTLLEDRPVFLYCAIPLVAVSAIGAFINEADDIFGLVVANTLITHTYVWNLLTASFFEVSWIKAGFDIVALFAVSKAVIIDSIEQFLLYFLFSLLACTLGVSVYCFGRFIFSGHDDALIVPLYGFNGVLTILMMYIRRSGKDRPILPQVPQVTFQNLPIVFLSMLFGLQFFAGKSYTSDFLFALVALLFSWSYLRFYYKFDDSEQLGTRGDEFSFVSMFPEVTHIVLIPFTTAFYNIMALLGVFPALEANERKPTHHLRYDCLLK